MILVGDKQFQKVVNDKISKLDIDNYDNLRIRELIRLVKGIEAETNTKFIRMEIGVPGIHANKISAEAESKAHLQGLASEYPTIEGVHELKKAGSDFVKQFLNLDIEPIHCVPTVGTMQASMATSMVVNRLDPKKNKTLFIDPGFPMQKQQTKLLGHEYDAFDVYDYRGSKLKDKLESYLKTGEYSALVYSNPNNPSWICFTDEELKIIGELSNKYEFIVLEDLAYFGMDFRKDYLIPGKAPYQPTIANYTDNYMLWISASKVFSYAGQRISISIVSPKLYHKKFPYLKKIYDHDSFGEALIYGAIYSLSSGVSHTVQYGFAALLNAANSGEYQLYDDLKLYKENAIRMKSIFLKNGFNILYDKDDNDDIADGFYFTVEHSKLNSSELVKLLLLYGISAVSLKLTGSEKDTGIRVCTSQIKENQFSELNERLKMLADTIQQKHSLKKNC